MRALLLLSSFFYIVCISIQSHAQNRLSGDELQSVLKAANQGDENAQYLAGMHYLSLSKTGNYQKSARKWLKRSADQGKPEAQYEFAKEMFRDRTRESDAIAFKYFEKASRQGHLESAVELAKMYYYGFGTLKYLNKAFDLFSIGANAGNAEAQYFASKMFLDGEGATIDEKQAFQWCKNSSDQNFKPAYLLLARMYYTGIGTPVNKVSAAELTKKAFGSGNPEAEKFWDENKLWKYTD
jgi:hypothetical protein